MKTSNIVNNLQTMCLPQKQYSYYICQIINPKKKLTVS